MRILVVTNMYPTTARPAEGTFVEQQVESLRRVGLQVEVLLASRGRRGPAVYFRLSKRLRVLLGTFQPDLVHVMYGGVMAEVVTRRVTERPVVVSFCGTDLLGGSYFHYPRRLAVRYGVYASRTAAARASGIIVKSRELADALPSAADSDKVWIIPNGVDLSRFRPLSDLAP